MNLFDREKCKRHQFEILCIQIFILLIAHDFTVGITHTFKSKLTIHEWEELMHARTREIYNIAKIITGLAVRQINWNYACIIRFQ